jgi:hypothetical protein
MRPTPLLLALLACSGFASSACAPALPRPDAATEALELPGLGPSGKRLDASYRATETSCRAEERRLSETASDRASTRRIAEALLALGAGGLAVASAVYAAVDPNPKGYVVVPLSAGAAVGTVPLGVLLLADGDAPEVREREERIRDRRIAVRDAYHRLADATGDRERAETTLDELTRRLSEQRIGEAERQIDAASTLVAQGAHAVAAAREAAVAAGGDRAPRDPPKGGDAKAGEPRPSTVQKLDEAKTQLDLARGAERAAIAMIGDGRAAVLDVQRAEVAYARQRERDAERVLGDALQRLGEVCGRAAP